MPFTSVAGEMDRFKKGQLHSGKGGPVVTDRQQAVAIALSEKRRHEGGESKAQEKLEHTRETIKSAAARRAHREKRD